MNSHVCEDGTERQIAYASQTLMGLERNYAQLEKEALSLVFGICNVRSTTIYMKDNSLGTQIINLTY